MASTFSGDYAVKAIVDQMVADLRARLKAPIMASLEKDVDAAVDQVIADLNVRAHAYEDVAHRAWRVLITLDDRRAKP